MLSACNHTVPHTMRSLVSFFQSSRLLHTEVQLRGSVRHAASAASPHMASPEGLLSRCNSKIQGQGACCCCI
jgi:hypothetical protein